MISRSNNRSSRSKWIQSAGVQLIRLPLIGFSLSTMLYVLTSNFRTELVSMFRVLRARVCVRDPCESLKNFFLNYRALTALRAN